MREKRVLTLLAFIFLLFAAACQPAPAAQTPLRSPQPATPHLPAPSALPSAGSLPSPSPQPVTTRPAPSPTAIPAEPTPKAEQGVSIASLWIYADHSGWASDLQQTKVFHTFNGGRTWRDVSPALTRGQNHLFFLDGKTAWISQSVSEANSYIWHSTDGGVKWLRFSQSGPGGQLSFSNTLNGLVLISLDVGMSQESVEIRQTADGGASWVVRWTHLPDEVNPSLPVSGSKENILVLDDSNVLVTGTWPVPKSLYAYHSDNAGFSWKQLSCEGLPELGGGDMWTAQMPIRAGGNRLILPVRAFASVGVDKTFFCSSNDRGNTWAYLSELDGTSLHRFTPSGIGLSAGMDKLYRSEDAGQSWKLLPFSVPAGQGIIALSLADGLNASILLSSLQSGPYAPAFLYQSSDGGLTWSFVPSEVVN